jgi:hypothetical protein
MLVAVRAEEVKPGEQSSLFQDYKDSSRGWTEAHHRHSKGSWMNGTLVVVTAAKEKKTFRASRGFIDRWGFADEGKSVVICSRNSHGPAWMEKYEIASGKLLAECSGSEFLESTPEWARPWCDATALAKEEKKPAPGQ